MLIGRKSAGLIILALAVLIMSAVIVLSFQYATLFIETFVLVMILTICVLGMRVGFKLLLFKSERPIPIEEIRKRVKKQTKRTSTGL